MDANSVSISLDMSQPAVPSYTNGALAVDYAYLPAACALCQRILSPNNEAGDLEAISEEEDNEWVEANEIPPYVGNSGDYLDARGFEELLEHLAETNSSRREAPPTIVSFVNSLPRVVIDEHEKQVGLACAICKEYLSVGTIVNQLPCFHLYHSSCIFPWLSARNSCPLCRYELPTDDKDYKEGKHNTISGLEIHEIEQQGMSEDGPLDITNDDEVDEAYEFSGGRIEQGELVNVVSAIGSSNRESERGRWFFVAAAAQIASLVGIVLVLWLGNPLAEIRGLTGHSDILTQGQHPNYSSSSCPPSQRESNRRW
ncbi:hypothetical protein F0562_017796 [Nyssa sinensis]|uniref:RING-type E3 ubiquitin transferase n=1 Tax=Nyssa sinensis TaxID=561372 RepID=A0A5J4ZIC4_9ASTE|nr:hypothetical protein F0562_017796 [Nyssa sinensis]